MSDLAGVEILWCNLWLDGPLEGVCEYEGRPHYFTWDDGDSNPKRFSVYALTDEEITFERQWHDRFTSTPKGTDDWETLQDEYDLAIEDYLSYSEGSFVGSVSEDAFYGKETL